MNTFNHAQHCLYPAATDGYEITHPSYGVSRRRNHGWRHASARCTRNSSVLTCVSEEFPGAACIVDITQGKRVDTPQNY
ncbi:hypothetical protein Y032_0202g1783 [Ancylostoma ceylanicum]|uniref:Uncharacterized protein n=1 Tax=Ancylostoma ceylanicum TaxID=53326 RepID=A0A016SN11_9BILA|nr:hypothetical protein Y032_0202g1783 [Ancylostoma ceylanicum]